MVISRCPRCGERVRIPSAAAEARVQCPWCTEQYDLAEALEALPPTLVVLEEGPAALATGIGLELDDASTAEDNEYFIRESDQDNASFQEIDTAVSGAAVRSGDTSGAAIRTRPTRRKRPSVIWMLIQWVGGGLAGVAIALAILWYLDRLPETEMLSWLNDWKRPAATPAGQPTLRDLRIRDEADTQFAMPRPAGDASGERIDNGAARNPDGDPEQTDELRRETPSDRNAPAPQAIERRDDRAEDGAGEDGADSRGGSPDPGEPAGDLTESEDFSALRQALERAGEIEDAQSEPARRAFLEVYQQLSAIGASADAGQANMASLPALLERAEAIEGLIAALAKTAPRWLELGARRPNAGVVAVGTLDSEIPPTLETTWGAELKLESAAGELDRMNGREVIVVGKLLEPETDEDAPAAARVLVKIVHQLDE